MPVRRNPRPGTRFHPVDHHRVDVRDGGREPKFAEDLQRWRACPGGVTADGHILTEPPELTRARTVLQLCDRFHCLPSQIEKEDAEVLRLIKIEALGRPPDDDDGGGGYA